MKTIRKGTLFPSEQLLIKHFEGNETLARVVLGLFIVGISVFVFNNTYLFFVQDESTYFWPRFFMRLTTSALWLIGACTGTYYNRTKRNMMLMPALLLYLIGDAVVFFSIPMSAFFYGAGHIFFLISILETTYIHRYQHVTFVILALVPVIAMIAYFGGLTLTGILGIVYGFICIAAMTASLSNRYFVLAGVFFAASDLAGLARIALLNNKVTYVCTTLIYYYAIFLLSISVFSDSRKESVTWGDLLNIFRKTKDDKLRIWLCGKWGMGLILGQRKLLYRRIDLAYDVNQKEEFIAWLKKNRYQSSSGSYEGRVFYSERYGHLVALPCQFNEDGVAVLTSAKRISLQLDPDFFQTINVLGRGIPCLAPGGESLIREAAGIGEDM